MQAAVVKVTVSLATGKVLQREVIEHIEVDGDEYYRPLVEILGKDIKDHIEAGESGRLRKTTQLEGGVKDWKG